MNCFKHSHRVAVGVCKSCGKGVCSECAISRKNGLACRGECEERVDLLNKIIDNNVKTPPPPDTRPRAAGCLQSPPVLCSWGLVLSGPSEMGLPRTALSAPLLGW